MEINKHVVDGFTEFDIGASQQSIAPKYASIACLSEAMIAIWTNRVPQYEPWPRELMVDTKFINESTDEYMKNVNHNLQLDPDSEVGAKKIGKLEGDVTITRNKFWRR